MAPIVRHYTGEDVEQLFINWLKRNVQEIYQKILPKPVKITDQEEASHKREITCWICDEKFAHENYKVRDHCHFTGKYRGASHNNCNLEAKRPDFMPFYFHNLAGYDTHLFIKYLGKSAGRINCIPNNEEKYISFTKDIWVGENGNSNIRFLDSFKFMSSCLDNLSSLELNLLKILSRFFSPELLPLVRRKGVFPYGYLDCFKRLEDKKLPP